MATVTRNPNLGANFYPKLVQISAEAGIRPEDLLAVMVSESGINPGAYEEKFHGAGLVGFMPDTLRGLGYKGSWEDFAHLPGEAQLDYVKKLVQGFAQTNGGPFTSAAQYYVANLWPVALRLPGIRQGNPSTVFIEEHPETTTDPKTGKAWSKKYFNLGYKISPEMESNAYKYNPLFHGSVPGAITYGDMMKQVEKNKRNPAYQKALVAMRDSAGYTPGKEEPTMVATQDKDNIFQRYYDKMRGKEEDIYQEMGSKWAPAPGAAPAASTNDYDQILGKYLQLAASTERSNKKLYKQFLPNNYLTIKVQARNLTDAVEFSRVLCTALDEELMAKAYTHTNGQEVEVECCIPGPEYECFETVKQLTESMADAFHFATTKVGGIQVKTQFITNKKSSYQQISLQAANNHYRKFLLKFI
jgi:hypothetical protein